MRLKPAAITPDKLYNNIKNNQNKCVSFGVSENIKQNKDVFEKSDKIEKPSVKNTNTIKEEIKDGIKQSAQKLEDAAKKELQEIKSEITANLPGKRIGNKFKKIFFLIIAPLGAITGAAVKFKDKILIFLKGLKNENNSNSGTEQK